MNKLTYLNKEISQREKEFAGIELHSTIESLIPMLGFKHKDTQSIYDFYNYIISFEYDHPGLTKELYMTHPIRVAKLVIQFLENFTEKEIMLALSHNILEVTKIIPNEINDNKLKKLLPYINILTVDRDLQWDDDYKIKYYHEIKKYKLTSVIKILDKLDNLFLLKNNPSSEIKLKYLNEIKKFIIPLTECHLPICKDLISNLVLYNSNLISKET